MYLWGVKTVDKEEEDLKIIENHDLNEEAEYAGNKQDQEKMLLDAQRYLNIFHQIHIFKDKKREEFDQSLIEMPERLRAILLNLPGGRVLLEHIEDCEIKRGLRTERTIFGNENPIVKSEKEMENKSAVGKEFTKAITDTIAGIMAEYNQSLLQMNEKILNNSRQDNNNSPNQAKILADALRESNQQQMEMMKTFGSTLSQAILMSQKEIFASMAKPTETNPVFNNSIKKNTGNEQPENKETNQVKTPAPQTPSKNENDNVKPKAENQQNTNFNQQNADKQKAKPTENFVKQDNHPKTDAPLPKENKPEIKSEVKPIPKQEVKIENKFEPKAEVKAETKPEVKTRPETPEIKPLDIKSDEGFDDIDIANLLTASEEPVEKQVETPKLEKKKEKAEEKPVSKPSPFSAAMQKIKNAITEPADISLDEINVKPISLSGDDDLTTSMTDAFKVEKKETSLPPAFDYKLSDDEEWEYVDEDGNPIDPSEWEYVDENGNPIDPSAWEYVDENGNPVDPGEWEYVDENGNPIKK